MSSSIGFGLNIARSSLSAYQQVMNSISHNVANANTPGYSRQKVELSASSTNRIGVKTASTLTAGAGVNVEGVKRVRNEMFDEIFRRENSGYQFYKEYEQLVGQIEHLYDEPSERGLSNVITEFYNSWHDLSNDPQNLGARQNVLALGKELSTRMKRLYNELTYLQENVDNEIANYPDEINQITAEIAELNGKIGFSERQQLDEADLRDRRDYLLDKLSEYGDIKTITQSDGAITVIMGNALVVDRSDSVELTTKNTDTGGQNVKITDILVKDEAELHVSEGRLAALLQIRDDLAPDLKNRLNEMAEFIVEEVNYEHQFGYGLDGFSNRDFFNPGGTSAFNMRVSDDMENVQLIAASQNGGRGDNRVAMRIAEKLNMKYFDDHTLDITEFYNTMVVDVGIQKRDATRGLENEEILKTQTDNARESYKGVSVDEEMIQMIQGQHIYQGASRLIVTLDTMLQAIINMK